MRMLRMADWRRQEDVGFEVSWSRTTACPRSQRPANCRARPGRLPKVLDGVMAAKEAGLKAKINAAALPRAFLFQRSQRLSNASQWRLHV